MHHLVSIVVPVYNAERYLDRCITSLLNQDYPNIELILVNDGSTDGSLEICAKFAERFSEKIQLINQQNQGASIARKNGIKASNGKYLMFADSDDFVSEKYVSALYDALVKLNTEIALCPVKRIEIDEIPHFAKVPTIRIMRQEELFRRFFKYEFWGFVCGIYNRNVFDNLNFPIATVNEDYYVKAQMFVRQTAVGYVEEALYCYEQHPGSLSKQPLSLRALGEFDNAKATWEFISHHAPAYSKHSLAIASEAACKWLSALNTTDSRNNVYIHYKYTIRQFVIHNFYKIIFNPHLLWKIKIIIMCQSIRRTTK
ncbi:MAG: glycosyltransferase [Muribaculum sp.]|nr:glycosyltransferase [Muribaculum sp.]